MKPINEIVDTQYFKNHIFTAAFSRYGCERGEGPSLYHDWNIIIYRLKDAPCYNGKYDEICIEEIPKILNDLCNVDKTFYERMMEIYNMFMALSKEFEYDIELDKNSKFSDLFHSYGCEKPSEMWENEEFAKIFKEKVDVIEAKIRPLQELVQSLRRI
jgi:hypothetical protein